MTRVVVAEETETDIMVAFILSGDPGKVGITRCLVRAALEYRGLGVYADDAETVTSELVTNAIQHATADVYAILARDAQ
jgi:anti-sigma regulatory factor (Ser/Thr protein kinase)